jgi:hypothetical protein
MDIKMIIDLIGSVGFPIVVCITLFYVIREQTIRYTKTIDDLRETIHGNTKILAELYTLIKERKNER